MSNIKEKMNSAAERERILYFAVSLFLMLLVNRLVFPLARLFTAGAEHGNLSLPADALIPFLPWMIVIYVGVFAWWVYVIWLISGFERREADRFFTANLLVYGISFLVFVFFPTEIQRPELSGNSVWVFFVGLLYRFDSPDNLFPSIHCALGWLFWIGIRGRKEVPFGIRLAGFLLGIAVCISTVTIRQHVLADVFGGIVLSEICWLLAAIPALRRRYGAVVDFLMRRLDAFLRRMTDS